MTRPVRPTSVERSGPRAFAGVLCLSAVLIAGSALAAPPTEQAGVSSAVKGKVARMSTVTEDDRPEDLQVGSKVYMQDRVDSAKRGRAQLLLRDRSTFKLGPNSSVVIDEFIYDPDQGTGEMVVEAANGVFRFISGAIGKSNADDVQIDTPLGSLGVRGTIATVKIQRGPDGSPQETLFVLNGPGVDNNALAERGAIQVTAQGETVTVQRPGWGTFVRPGDAPRPPQPIPMETLDALNRSFDAPAGGEPATGDSEAGSAIAGTGVDRYSGQTTAQTRERGETSSELDASEQTADLVASGEELEDEQLPKDPVEDMNGTDRPTTDFGTLQTYAGLRQGGPGSASASQTGVPLYRVSDLESFDGSNLSGSDTVNDLTGLQLAGVDQVGSYDVNFEVDFSAKTFRLNFENISLPNVEGTSALKQAEAQPIPQGEIAAIFSASSGIDGVTATGACSGGNCQGLVYALKNDKRALSGILSALIAGPDPQVIGVGTTPAD